jgi:hypothetical protein
MDKIEKLLWLVTQSAFTFLAVYFCVKLCTGCTYLNKEQAHGTVAFVLREAYACGGATAVSNRIEQLVADGKVTPEQAKALHASAEKLYADVVEKFEADAAGVAK